MKEEQLKRWAKTRTMGAILFVAVYGVVYFGVLVGLAFAWLFPLVIRLLTGEHVPFRLALFVSLILFPIGGLVIGVCMWRSAEKDYRQWKDSARSNK